MKLSTNLAFIAACLSMEVCASCPEETDPGDGFGAHSGAKMPMACPTDDYGDEPAARGPRSRDKCLEPPGIYAKGFVKPADSARLYRVVLIQHDKTNKLSATLERRDPASNPPRFSALSYTWGSDDTWNDWAMRLRDHHVGLQRSELYHSHQRLRKADLFRPSSPELAVPRPRAQLSSRNSLDWQDPIQAPWTTPLDTGHRPHTRVSKCQPLDVDQGQQPLGDPCQHLDVELEAKAKSEDMPRRSTRTFGATQGKQNHGSHEHDYSSPWPSCPDSIGGWHLRRVESGGLCHPILSGLAIGSAESNHPLEIQRQTSQAALLSALSLAMARWMVSWYCQHNRCAACTGQSSLFSAGRRDELLNSDPTGTSFSGFAGAPLWQEARLIMA